MKTSSIVLILTVSLMVFSVSASDYEERIKEIIVEQLGVDEDEVKLESSFVDDLGADSLDTVELVMALEEEFGMEIPDEAAENILSFQDAVSYVKQQLGN